MSVRACLCVWYESLGKPSVCVYTYFPSPLGAQAECIDVFSESLGAWPVCVHFQSLWEPRAAVVGTLPLMGCPEKLKRLGTAYPCISPMPGA